MNWTKSRIRNRVSNFYREMSFVFYNRCKLSLFRSLILEKHCATHTFRYDCIYIHRPFPELK